MAGSVTDPVSGFPLEPESAESLIPRLKQADKLFREGQFSSMLEKLLAIDEEWPNHPAVLYRLMSAYRLTNESARARECVRSLLADTKPPRKKAALLSQFLFHCCLDLGDFDAAKVEAQEYFLKHPDEKSTYRDGYEELCKLQEDWTDEEINRSLQDSRQRRQQDKDLPDEGLPQT